MLRRRHKRVVEEKVVESIPPKPKPKPRPRKRTPPKKGGDK